MTSGESECCVRRVVIIAFGKCLSEERESAFPLTLPPLFSSSHKKLGPKIAAARYIGKGVK